MNVLLAEKKFEIFYKKGMDVKCKKCGSSELEKLKVGDIAKFYGINAEEVIKEINAYLAYLNAYLKGEKK